MRILLSEILGGPLIDNIIKAFLTKHIMDFLNNTLFSEDPFERQMLTQLENRLAFVINGSTGEKRGKKKHVDKEQAGKSKSIDFQLKK